MQSKLCSNFNQKCCDITYDICNLGGDDIFFPSVSACFNWLFLFVVSFLSNDILKYFTIFSKEEWINVPFVSVFSVAFIFYMFIKDLRYGKAFLCRFFVFYFITPILNVKAALTILWRGRPAMVRMPWDAECSPLGTPHHIYRLQFYGNLLYCL